jgi:hypothetical protein
VLVLLKLLIVYAALAALLWIFANFIHNYLYTGAPPSLRWRAPAAAGILWLLGLAGPWAVRSESGGWPIAFNDFFLFSTGKADVEFKELTIPGGGGRRDKVYKRTRVPRGVGGETWEYRDDNGEPMPSTPLVLLAKEDDKTVRFDVVKDEKGYIDRGPDPNRPLPVRWKDDQGRVMSAENFGRIASSGTGGFFFHLFALVVAWGLWFLCLWLLLLLQWPHALGLSIPLWFVWIFSLNFVLEKLG